MLPTPPCLQVDMQRARLPQTRAKGEYEMENTIKVLQHKESKLSACRQSFKVGRAWGRCAGWRPAGRAPSFGHTPRVDELAAASTAAAPSQ